MLTVLTKWSWVLVLLLPTIFSSGSTNGIFKGTVTDSEGAAIRHARVYVHWDDSGAGVRLRSNLGIRQDLSVETNQRGEFTVELPAGFYDVFVSANAFTPQCRKLRVRSGETATFSPKLIADPVVTKELGNQF